MICWPAESWVAFVAVEALPLRAPTKVGAVILPVEETAPVPALILNDQSVPFSVLPDLNP